MEVILEKTVEKLGLVGTVVKVKEGFARNYLLPEGLAVKATKHNLQVVEKKIKVIREKELEEKENASEVAKKLEGASINIEVRASDDGKLFGSVTEKEIAESLKEKGFDIDKSKVKMDEHFKYLGVYNVIIKLHAMVQVEVKIWVIRETENEK